MAGFQVKGEKLNTQITSDSPNIMLDRVDEINSDVLNIGLKLVSSPIVAVRPNQGGIISDVYNSNSSDGSVVNGSGVVYQFSTEAKKGDFGLEVYKEDGSLAYSSSKQLLKVVGSGVVTLDNPVTLKYDYPVAILFNTSLHAIYPSGGFTGLVNMSGVAGNEDGSITIGRYVIDVIGNYPGDNADIGVDTSEYLVIDVSDIKTTS